MLNLIFDMDGTLIDSANAISSAVNEIRSTLSLPPLPREEIMQKINTPKIDWARELYEIENFEQSSFKDGFDEYFVKHYRSSVVVFEGLCELLEEFKSQGHYLAIATNAPQSSLAQLLAKHSIMHFFDQLIGVREGLAPKPDPAMLRLILSQAPAQKSIFIGDSQKDRLAARAAGLAYLNARWYAGGELGPDEFASAGQLRELVGKFQGEAGV